MIIKRTLNGIQVEIELTANEVISAYEEQEHIYDVKDIQTILDDEYDDDMYEGVPVKSLMDKADDIAYKYRKIIDESEFPLHWREAAEQAISNFIKEEKLL